MALFFNLEEKVEEKWIWVEGYKGTTKDMTCHDCQYELGKRYDMPKDAEIKECQSGFHLCLNLSDVYGYYKIENDNRFFKVRALVREDDAARYAMRRKTKIVARSIEFISECTTDEIFGVFPENDMRHWTAADKASAISHGIREVAKAVGCRVLVGLGYSAPFADFLFEQRMFLIAEAVGSQADLSMDMKVWMIMTAIHNKQLDVDRLGKCSAMLKKTFTF